MIDSIKEKTHNYKISVIVPIYKVEDYLERCVDSIINQSYKNLEIILVDDGSPDNCSEICDRYAKLDSRIKVIHQKNGGLSCARNSGLRIATGDFISLVDSDDYINSNMYADLIEQIIVHKADIAMCDCEYVYEKDTLVKVNEKPDSLEVSVLDGKKAQYMAFRDDISRIVFNVAWNKLYRKELFQNISYPEGRIHEDEARTHQLMYNASKIVYLKYPYYYYFQRKDSIVGMRISKKNLQLLEAYADKLKFYREKKENKLWKMEVSHSMHMVCYQQKLFDDEKMSIDIIREAQGKILLKEIKRYESISDLSIALKFEIILFVLFPKMYYKVWKMRKG